jgi:hypothetical protein
MKRIERVSRGLAATSFAILLAAMSHVIAGAETPSLLAIIVTILVALPLSVALAGVRLSITRLTALVLASQALFHFSFAMIGSQGLSTLADSEAAHTSHTMSAMGSASVIDAATMSATSAAAMWFAHAVAAAVTVVALTYGERAAVALLTVVLAALAALRSYRLTLADGWATLKSPVAVDAHPIALRVTRTHSRRGPPAFFA